MQLGRTLGLLSVLFGILMLILMIFIIHCHKRKEKSVQQEVVNPNLEQVLTTKELPTYDEVMKGEEPPSYELAMKTKELPTYEEVIDANYIEILDVPASVLF